MAQSSVPKDQITITFRLLKKEFGPVEQKQDDVLEQLIRTLLSHQTTSINTRRALENLCDAYPTWQDVMDAPANELEEVIRVAGLAKQKADKIKRCLNQVGEDFGEYSLEGLHEWSNEAVLEYLESLPGVGQKTARCVLIFAMARSGLPVDTHVGRIAKRLGWVHEDAKAEEIASHLESQIPPKKQAAFHVYFFEHGRKTCRSRNPKCDVCSLSVFCPSSTS